MLEDDKSLATVRDKDNKTALHLFARMPSAFAKQSSSLPGKLINSCKFYIFLHWLLDLLLNMISNADVCKTYYIDFRSGFLYPNCRFEL